eukprot:sb/3462965/
MPSPPSMVNAIMQIFVKFLQCEKKLPDDLTASLPHDQDELMTVPDVATSRRKTKARIKAPINIKPVEMDKKDKKERDQWLLVQGALQDAQAVRDGISKLSWEDGLNTRTVETVQSMLKKLSGMLPFYLYFVSTIRTLRLVESLLNLVDKNCLDGIRVMPSPPSMVNAIMQIFVKFLQCEKKLPDDLTASLPHDQDELMTVPDVATSRRKTKARIKAPINIKPVEMDKKDKKERDQWLLVQGALQDAQAVRDGISKLSWEDGLNTRTVETVQSMLKKLSEDHGDSEEQPLPSSSFRRRRMSIDMGQDIDVSDKNIGKLDEAAVSHASEKVGHIYKFILALVAYHQAYAPVAIAREQTTSLEALLKEIEKEEKLERELAEQTITDETGAETAISKLEEEISTLQCQYEEAVVRKRGLQTECQSIREKLRAMSTLTGVLKREREKWEHVVDSHQSHLLVIGNCVLAAAFLAYCAHLTGERRKVLYGEIREACRIEGMEGHLLEQEELVEFIMGDTIKYQWISRLLPRDSHFMENTMLATHLFSPQWITLFDSEGVSEQWLKTLHSGREVVTTSFYHTNLRGELENAITTGKILAVTEVDDGLISEDPRFRDLISKGHDILTEKFKKKVQSKKNKTIY